MAQRSFQYDSAASFPRMTLISRPSSHTACLAREHRAQTSSPFPGASISVSLACCNFCLMIEVSVSLRLWAIFCSIWSRSTVETVMDQKDHLPKVEMVGCGRAGEGAGGEDRTACCCDAS